MVTQTHANVSTPTSSAGMRCLIGGKLALPLCNGDWNGNGEFDSSDFVSAFQSGGYELGPKWDGAAQVPEPSSVLLASFGIVGFGLARRRK